MDKVRAERTCKTVGTVFLVLGIFLAIISLLPRNSDFPLFQAMAVTALVAVPGWLLRRYYRLIAARILFVLSGFVFALSVAVTLNDIRKADVEFLLLGLLFGGAVGIAALIVSVIATWRACSAAKYLRDSM